MFRTLLFTAGLLLVTAGASAAPVPAGPKADDAVPYPTAKLLKYRQVQKELRMTAEQRINLHDALEDIEEEYEKRLLALDKLPNVPDEAFQKVEKDRLKALEKLLTTTGEKVLTPVQRARLRQVGRQVSGPAAFADPQVQKALQLGDDEKKAAAALAEQAEAKADLYLTHLGDDDEDKVKAEVVAFRKESVKQFTGLLTAERRDAWKALLGEPVQGFDADALWLRLVEEEDLDALD
jgi:hypothetical protein